MKGSSSKQILLSVLGVAILVVAVVGVSFAAFTFTKAGTKENTISTGTIQMTYNEPTDGITITNAMPMTDAAGIAQKDVTGGSTHNTFKFTVGATIAGTTTINYEVVAAKKAIAQNALANNEVKLYLASVGSNDAETQVMAPKTFTPTSAASAVGSPSGVMLLTSGSFTATGTRTYILKMWVPETYVVSGTAKSFSVTVSVYAKAS